MEVRKGGKEPGRNKGNGRRREGRGGGKSSQGKLIS